MKITEQDWMLRTDNEAHYNECLEYARLKQVPIDANDSEYEPKNGYTEIVWMGPGLGSLHFEEGGYTLITQEEFKSMCDEYAANKA